MILLLLVAVAESGSSAKTAMSCRVCELLSRNMYDSLIHGQFAKELAKTRRKFAAKENVIENALEGACEFTNIFNNKTLLTVCEEFLDKKREELVEYFLHWDFPNSNLAEEENKVQIHETTQNLCSVRLSLCPSKAYEPEAPAPTLHSQHPPWPKWPTGDGRVHPIVAGTLVDIITGAPEANTKDKDVVIYYSFPDEPCHGTAFYDNQPKPDPKTAEVCRTPLSADRGELHKKFYHVYQELAWVMRNSSNLYVGHYDARSNDLFPPYDGVDSPTVVLYPASRRNTPSYYQNLRRMELDLYDLLMYVWRSGDSGTQSDVLSVVKSLREHDENRLVNYHTADYFKAKRLQDKEKEKAQDKQKEKAEVEQAKQAKIEL